MKINYSEFHKYFLEIERIAKEVWKEEKPETYSSEAVVTSIEDGGVGLEYTAHCWGSYQESYFVNNIDIDAYYDRTRN